MKKVKTILLLVTFPLVLTLIFLALVNRNAYALDLSKKLTSRVFICSSSLVPKIETKIGEFDDKQSNHQETYATLKIKLSDNIEEWEDWGYDVSDLEHDLINLTNMISEFNDAASTLRDGLDETKDGCLDLSDYEDSLDLTKKALSNLRDITSEIRMYYQTTVRVHILELMLQDISAE